MKEKVNEPSTGREAEKNNTLQHTVLNPLARHTLSLSPNVTRKTRIYILII